MRLPRPLVRARSATAAALGKALRLVEPARRRLALYAYEIWARSRLRGPIEPGVQFFGPITVEGTGNVSIGAGTRLGRGVYLETQGSGRIEIGRDVVITHGATLVAYEGIRIGDYTMMGEYTSVRDANHGMELGRPIRLQGHEAAPIRIGTDVWLGRGVCVLKGVTIDDEAVVGANSTVTRDVEKRSVVVGSPARKIGERGA